MKIKDDVIELARYVIFPDRDTSMDAVLPTHRGKEMIGKQKDDYLIRFYKQKAKRNRLRRQRRHNRRVWKAYLESRKW